MEIRNNTDYLLELYFGDSDKEEPTAVKTLKTGEAINLANYPNEDISIQEKRRNGKDKFEDRKARG